MIFDPQEFVGPYERAAGDECRRESLRRGKGNRTMEKDPSAEVRRILERSARRAAKVLCSTLSDETTGQKERYAAALEILNRLYGRSLGGAESTPEQIEVVMRGSTADWAK